MVEVKNKRDRFFHCVKPIYQFDENEAVLLLSKAKDAIIFLLQTEKGLNED